MAEPRYLQVGNETPTETVSGGQGLSSAQVGTEAKTLSNNESEQVGVYVANENQVVDNSRQLQVSEEKRVGQYIKAEAQSEVVEREKVVDTILVREVKELIDDSKYLDDSPKRYHTKNIKALPGELLEKLECGDIIVKHTMESEKDLQHTYFVTHKQATGICLSYFNAGYSETVSYDKIESVWTFNSIDTWVAE